MDALDKNTKSQPWPKNHDLFSRFASFCGWKVTVEEADQMNWLLKAECERYCRAYCSGHVRSSPFSAKSHEREENKTPRLCTALVVQDSGAVSPFGDRLNSRVNKLC